MARHSFTRPAYVIRTGAPSVSEEFTVQANMVLREIRGAGAAGITSAELVAIMHVARSYQISELTKSLVDRGLILDRDGRWHVAPPKPDTEA